MATNNFLAFCPTDTGTNLLTQVEYAADPDRSAGNQPGVASSKLNNKAIRQAAAIMSQVAQYISDKTGNDVLDDGNLTNIQNTMIAAWASPTSSYQISNLTIASSVAASALTIAIKTKANANASATDVITVGMRSATLTSGLYNSRTITGALSIVVPSSATLGQTSGQPSFVWVYLIDNAGTLELAVSHSFYPENALVTTTTISSGATSATAIYSTTGRSNVPLRCIGYILNTQATAGTWASAGTQIQLLPGNNDTNPTFTEMTSGTGTFVTPAGAKAIRVRAVGGGGGGAGSGSSGGTAAGTGGTTTFGTTLISCTGGAGGSLAASGGAGGTASIGSLTQGFARSGSPGSGGFNQSGGSSNQYAGGSGGVSPFAGAGGGGGSDTAGTAAVANTGSGGGGGGIGAVANGASGSGGGAGGYVDVMITNPLSSYAWAVGAAGSAGGAGASGRAGGAGALGYLCVDIFY